MQIVRSLYTCVYKCSPNTNSIVRVTVIKHPAQKNDMQQARQTYGGKKRQLHYVARKKNQHSRVDTRRWPKR